MCIYHSVFGYAVLKFYCEDGADNVHHQQLINIIVMYIYLYNYVRMYVCMYVCMYTIYVCMYVYYLCMYGPEEAAKVKATH